MRGLALTVALLVVNSLPVVAQSVNKSTDVGLVFAAAFLSFTVSSSTQAPSPAQGSKRIALTARSTVPIAVLAEGMDKNCSGVVLTADTSKADYLLEATSTERFVDGDSVIRAQFTLFSANGDVLFHTTTRRYANAMKDVCNAIGLGKKKK